MVVRVRVVEVVVSAHAAPEQADASSAPWLGSVACSGTAGARLLRRIVAEHRRAIHVALGEAHADVLAGQEAADGAGAGGAARGRRTLISEAVRGEGGRLSPPSSTVPATRRRPAIGQK